jgi:sigma-B regulation protein RsbU (phosphoserine phosphatase)
VTVLNRNLSERGIPGRFVTFFYGLLDPATGLFEYANAGHNYPLILRADGTVDQLQCSGLVLGIFPAVTYESSQAQLQPGDTLALYSDGVTEASHQSLGEFGEQGLGEFLGRYRQKSCREAVNALASEVRAWCGSNSLADDFTVLLARRL